LSLIAQLIADGD